jgi:hypothetical protein
MLNAPGRVARATFVVTADRCPQILCRVLGLVAQQGRMIERVDAVDTRRILRVTLSVADIEARHAAIIAEKMRQLVSVRTVRLQAVTLGRSSPAAFAQATASS